jgi:excisionase family DNA binding protein
VAIRSGGDWLSPGDVAARLGLSRASVYWWLRKRNLPHRRLGGRILVNLETARAAMVREVNGPTIGVVDNE